jgi:hypothetical protein
MDGSAESLNVTDVLDSMSTRTSTAADEAQNVIRSFNAFRTDLVQVTIFSGCLEVRRI